MWRRHVELESILRQRVLDTLMAERLKDPRVATFDRRDLSLVRPRHVDAFEILP